jgi:hypothetical protein
MFVQVIQGQVAEPAELRAALERWEEELAPGAAGWLGSTAGVTEDGTFVLTAMFESAEEARRNSDRPEQGEWWAALAERVTDPSFADYDQIRVFRTGASPDARFVQVMRGWTEDPDRLAELARQDEAWLESEAPHILGIVSCRHAEGAGDFTEVVYFTNEDEARSWERNHPMEAAAEMEPAMAQMLDLMKDVQYFDLRDPLHAQPR